MKQVRKEFSCAEDAVSELQIPISRIQRFLNRYDIRGWPLENSTNKAVREGRKAELFVMALPEFIVLRDCWNRSAKEPYDMILKGYGAVDVKSTFLKRCLLRGYAKETDFWSFNIGLLARATKFCFLVGYNPGRDSVLALFIFLWLFLEAFRQSR